MANPKGFENVVSRPLLALDPSEFTAALLMAGNPHEGRGRRELEKAYVPEEMEIDSDKVRLQSRLSPRGTSIEEVPAPVVESEDEKFVSVLETGDFRPLTFVTGMEALKDGAPVRPPKSKLPTAKVFKIRGQRWQEYLRYCD